jgi:FHS family L-fucose permease-like MFS transporter
MPVANVNVPSGTVSMPASGSTYRVALMVVTSLFFMWGFLTCLNDILVQHLKSIFELNISMLTSGHVDMWSIILFGFSK